jgi:hypothetical protein
VEAASEEGGEVSALPEEVSVESLADMVYRELAASPGASNTDIANTVLNAMGDDDWRAQMHSAMVLYVGQKLRSLSRRRLAGVFATAPPPSLRAVGASSAEMQWMKRVAREIANIRLTVPGQPQATTYGAATMADLEAVREHLERARRGMERSISHTIQAIGVLKSCGAPTLNDWLATLD